MSAKLIPWFKRFFNNSGIKTSPNGRKEFIIKPKMMTYSYKYKSQFFEESCFKTWTMKQGIESNFYEISKTLRNSYPVFWELPWDWDLETLGWLEIILTDDVMNIAIDTGVFHNEFKVEMQGDYEKVNLCNSGIDK